MTNKKIFSFDNKKHFLLYYGEEKFKLILGNDKEIEINSKKVYPVGDKIFHYQRGNLSLLGGRMMVNYQPLDISPDGTEFFSRGKFIKINLS